MTHPHFISALPPVGARSLVFRPPPAHVIDDHKPLLTMQCDSTVTVQASYDIPIRRSERHPGTTLSDQSDENAVEFTLI